MTVVHGPFHVLFEMERNRGRRTRRRFCLASVRSSRLSLPILPTVRRRWEKRRRIEERSQLPHSPVLSESAVVAAQQDITRRPLRYYLQGVPGSWLHALMMTFCLCSALMNESPLLSLVLSGGREGNGEGTPYGGQLAADGSRHVSSHSATNQSPHSGPFHRSRPNLPRMVWR